MACLLNCGTTLCEPSPRLCPLPAPSSQGKASSGSLAQVHLITDHLLFQPSFFTTRQKLPEVRDCVRSAFVHQGPSLAHRSCHIACQLHLISPPACETMLAFLSALTKPHKGCHTIRMDSFGDFPIVFFVRVLSEMLSKWGFVTDSPHSGNLY